MKHNKQTAKQLIAITAIALYISAIPISIKAYVASDFHWRPPFTMANEIPSITILLDSSDAMHRMAYAFVSEPNSNIADVYQEYGNDFDSTGNPYLGYFKNTWYSYNFAEEYFEVNATEPHDGKFHGNFMNWATMHRLDVVKIILTGGAYDNNTKTFSVTITDAVKDQYSTDEELKKKISGNVRPVKSDNGFVPYSGMIVQVPQTNSIRFYDKDPNKFNNANIIAGDFKLRIKDENPLLKGVLDDYSESARFALARYYIRDADEDGVHDDKSNTHKGAKMLVHMDQNGTSTMDEIKTQINKIWPSSKAAPLAEAIFTVSGYVMQMSDKDDQFGPKYEDDAFDVSKEKDPYYFSKYDELVSCTQQNIILITPGESAFGDSIPIGDNKIVKPLPYYPRDYDIVRNGKYYIQDTAHWMHTNDLRDLNGKQDIDLFVVRAFGVENTADLLKDAAMFGGFRDRDGNKMPMGCGHIDNQGICTEPDFEVSQKEFDNDGDGVPDNYFAADDDKTGDGLQDIIRAAFEAATRRVTSGTAAAVTSQTRSGDGAVYQALFFPPTESDDTPLAPPWSGQVNAMLVDSEGNIREDTNGSRYLDAGDAKIIFMGEQIARYAPGSTTPEYLNSTQEINFLWSSTPLLNALDNEGATSQRQYDSTVNKRYIFTFADAENDGVVKLNSEIQAFDNATCDLSTNNFCNYLTLFEDTSRDISESGSDKGFEFSELEELANRQVDFIRGAEITNKKIGDYNDNVRSRALDNESKPWRLGDIVYSSPTIVGAPAENYHRLYKDKTYQEFFDKYRNRRQVLYVGANDGMLHAFNAGFYNSDLKGFDLSQNGEREYPLGMELWAYVPYNLLPHLKWLMNPDYGGSLPVPYMDLKPRVFDARIFVNNDGSSKDPDIYPHGWGTVLVAGMRLGGAEIKVDVSTDKDNSEFRTMRSAYVIMDITNPEVPPKLLAEVRLPEQGFTTSYPTVMPMATANSRSDQDLSHNHWFLVFGSGPADSLGNPAAFPIDYRKPAVSDQNGRLFVLDLKALAENNEIRTLDSTKKFSVSDHKPFAITELASFIGDPIAVDYDIGSSDNSKAFKTDVIYFGTASGDEINSGGTMRRLTTSNIMPTEEEADWSTSTLFDAGLPITSAAAAAVDETNRLWIYFGTGRFYNRDDIPQNKKMSFFGIKEPLNKNTTPYTYTWATVNASDLYNSTRLTLKTTDRCGTKFTKDCIDVVKTTLLGNSTMDWDAMVAEINSAEGGWRQDFIPKWERVLGQPAILGGTVLFTSYIPDTDICEPEGLSRLYGLFYKTGTAYYDPILGTLGDTVNTFVGLGKGLAITPSIHVGDDGVTAYIQTSSGAIETIDVVTPFSVRPGPIFWRKNTN